MISQNNIRGPKVPLKIPHKLTEAPKGCVNILNL